LNFFKNDSESGSEGDRVIGSDSEIVSERERSDIGNCSEHRNGSEIQI
jgi:hypothetical protein